MSDFLSIFVHPLIKGRFRYMVTGSVASSRYGQARFTADVDLVLEMSPDQAPRLEEIFDQESYYVPPREVLEIEAGRRRRGHFNLIHLDSGMRADVYLRSADPLVDWAFDNLDFEESSHLPIAFAPPEYVILSKLDYFREGGSEKHLDDIRLMIAVLGGTLRREVIESFAKSRGTYEAWQKHFASSN